MTLFAFSGDSARISLAAATTIAAIAICYSVMKRSQVVTQ